MLVCVRAIQDCLVVASRASKRVIFCSTASVSSFVSVFGHGNSVSYCHLTCERTFCQLGGFSLTGGEKGRYVSSLINAITCKACCLCITSLCSVHLVLLITFYLQTRLICFFCLFVFCNHMNIKPLVAVLSQVSPSSRQVEAIRVRRHQPFNQKSKSYMRLDDL